MTGTRERILDATSDLFRLQGFAGTRAVFAAAAEVLRQSGYADACPIATVALEVASTNEQLREATARVFEAWVVTLAGRLAADGAEPATARATAIVVIELLEGAFLLCRAARATEAMDAAGTAAVALVTAALTAT